MGGGRESFFATFEEARSHVENKYHVTAEPLVRSTILLPEDRDSLVVRVCNMGCQGPLLLTEEDVVKHLDIMHSAYHAKKFRHFSTEQCRICREAVVTSSHMRNKHPESDFASDGESKLKESFPDIRIFSRSDNPGDSNVSEAVKSAEKNKHRDGSVDKSKCSDIERREMSSRDQHTSKKLEEKVANYLLLSESELTEQYNKIQRRLEKLQNRSTNIKNNERSGKLPSRNIYELGNSGTVSEESDSKEELVKIVKLDENLQDDCSTSQASPTRSRSSRHRKTLQKVEDVGEIELVELSD